MEHDVFVSIYTFVNIWSVCDGIEVSLDPGAVTTLVILTLWRRSADCFS